MSTLAEVATEVAETPIGDVIAAVVGLVAAMDELYESGSAIPDAVDALFDRATELTDEYSATFR